LSTVRGQKYVREGNKAKMWIDETIEILELEGECTDKNR
jgi:hypothetical protein